jgi:hypothetical protein
MINHAPTWTETRCTILRWPMSDLSLRYRIEFQCTPNAQPTDSNSLGRREASNVATSLAGHTDMENRTRYELTTVTVY